MNKGQIAKLAGAASLDRGSGLDARRPHDGGRQKQIRDALYVAALLHPPTMKACNTDLRNKENPASSLLSLSFEGWSSFSMQEGANTPHRA